MDFKMTFPPNERKELLKVKGVGETVIKRIEQIGISTFANLSHSSVDEIVETVAKLLNTTCWKNSPQAKTAIQGAIDCAKEFQSE